MGVPAGCQLPAASLPAAGALVPSSGHVPWIWGEMLQRMYNLFCFFSPSARFSQKQFKFCETFFFSLFMTDALVAQRDGREGEPCVISHPNSATDWGNPIFAALRTPVESGEAKTERFQQTLMKKTLFQAGLPFLFPTHTAPIIAGAPQILLPPHFFPVSPSDHGRRGPNWDRPEPAPAACSEPLGGFFFAKLC